MTAKAKKRLDDVILPKRRDPSAFPHIIPIQGSGFEFFELSPERVIVRDYAQGLAAEVPLSSYEGVVLKALPDAKKEEVFSIYLYHPDPELNIDLAIAIDFHALADWRLWASLLTMPMLLENDQGEIINPFPSLGALVIGEVCKRRRGFATIRNRRPRGYMRRRTFMRQGKPIAIEEIREIIARN